MADNLLRGWDAMRLETNNKTRLADQKRARRLSGVELRRSEVNEIRKRAARDSSGFFHHRQGDSVRPGPRWDYVALGDGMELLITQETSATDTFFGPDAYVTKIRGIIQRSGPLKGRLRKHQFTKGDVWPTTHFDLISADQAVRDWVTREVVKAHDAGQLNSIKHLGELRFQEPPAVR